MAKKTAADLKKLSLEELVDEGGKLNAQRKKVKAEEDKYKAELLRRLKAETGPDRQMTSALGLKYIATVSYAERFLLDIERVRGYLKAKAKQFEYSSPYHMVSFSRRSKS